MASFPDGKPNLIAKYKPEMQLKWLVTLTELIPHFASAVLEKMILTMTDP
jgi:hypothetical protein